MKVRPPIQPGRLVLRRQPDGLFVKDHIYMALVVKWVGTGKDAIEVREDGVLRWGSTHHRVKADDYWVNYVRDW